jgi:Zn-dependent peptidase ImmA (M78 family)
MSKARKKWVGSEARSLIECTGLGDPEAAINKLVHDLLQETEQRTVPINLPVVASFRGISEIRFESMTVAAMLMPVLQGLIISVNVDDPLGRRNFSIAHEICHTLFPSYAKHPVHKVDTFTGGFPIPQEEEYLCDIGASHLLLPPSLVLTRIQSCPICLDSINQLSVDFQSSLEAAAIAWTQASPSPCAVVFFEETLKPTQIRRKNQLILPGMQSDFRLEPELRVSLTCASPSFPGYIPKYKSVDRDGVIYAALASESRTTGKDVIELRNKRIEVEAESCYVPYRRQGTVQKRVVSFLTWTGGMEEGS